MITAERLRWLQDNKIHGEVAAVVKKLNPKKSDKLISYSEALSIINGNLWGTHGKLFTDELEKVIRTRLAAAEKEKAKYATT